MPLSDIELEEIEPIPPPFYSGPEFARIQDKAKKMEDSQLTSEQEQRISDEAERIAWGRAKYQKLSRPSRSMRDLARQEVLCRLHDQTFKRKRGYG